MNLTMLPVDIIPDGSSTSAGGRFGVDENIFAEQDLTPLVPFRVNPFRMNPSPYQGEGDIEGEVVAVRFIRLA
jgi:hypothetical protein